MITKKDQNDLLDSIRYIHQTLGITDEACKRIYGFTKEECITNGINALEHKIADLR